MLYSLSTDYFPTRLRPRENSNPEARQTYVFNEVAQLVKEHIPSFKIIKSGEPYQNQDYLPRCIDFFIEAEERELLDYVDEIDELQRDELYSGYFIGVPEFADIVVDDELSVGGIIGYIIATKSDGFDSREEIVNVPLS